MPRQESDALFLAIAHPSRRLVLELLLEHDELSAGTLLTFVPVTFPALSQHLRVLVDADLVSVRAEGRHRYYRLEPKPLLEVAAWMHGFESAWRDHPDRLGDHLDRQHLDRQHPPRTPEDRWT